jgi:AraC family transcriptional regulator of adaptative response / DNA-3-methyladenine glycosylase II
MQAGFRSVRQFNHAVRATFGRTPSELRARRAGGTVHGGRSEERGAGPALTLALPYRPPYDWTAVVDYLAPRAIPGVEQVGPEGYARTVRLDGRVGILRVTPAPDSEAVPRGARSVERVAPAGHHLVLELDVDLPATRRLAEVVRRVRRLFDLDADPLTVAEHLGGDPCLRPVIERRPGLRVPGAWDPFELAVRAVLGQQVSVRGATTLAGRLVRAFGTPLGDGDTPRAAGQAGGTDRLTHLFPVPAVLARAPESALAAIGLTGARAACVRALARAVASDLGAAPSPGAPGSPAGWFDGAAGLEQVVARLTALPGIGPWTAHYIALRALREPDALPAGDLGLRRALAACRGEARPVAPRTLERAAESWSPWRGYAAMHLWASL